MRSTRAKPEIINIIAVEATEFQRSHDSSPPAFGNDMIFSTDLLFAYLLTMTPWAILAEVQPGGLMWNSLSGSVLRLRCARLDQS